jgi:hypothetical protein
MASPNTEDVTHSHPNVVIRTDTTQAAARRAQIFSVPSGFTPSLVSDFSPIKEDVDKEANDVTRRFSSLSYTDPFSPVSSGPTSLPTSLLHLPTTSPLPPLQEHTENISTPSLNSATPPLPLPPSERPHQPLEQQKQYVEPPHLPAERQHQTTDKPQQSLEPLNAYVLKRPFSQVERVHQPAVQVNAYIERPYPPHKPTDRPDSAGKPHQLVEQEATNPWDNVPDQPNVRSVLNDYSRPTVQEDGKVTSPNFHLYSSEKPSTLFGEWASPVSRNQYQPVVNTSHRNPLPSGVRAHSVDGVHHHHLLPTYTRAHSADFQPLADVSTNQVTAHRSDVILEDPFDVEWAALATRNNNKNVSSSTNPFRQGDRVKAFELQM